MDSAQPITHYQSSRGPLEIATMAYPHLTNAIAKMEREGRDSEAVYRALVSRRNVLDAENEAATASGNNGAPEATTFESVKAKLEDLRIEAGNWLDGAEITTQSECDALAKLLRMVQAAAKEADEARKVEKKPFDDGAAEVQERYNTLIGNTTKVKGLAVRMEEALKAASTKWLRKIAAEQEAARQEAARKAEEARQQAEAHIAATHDTTDLDDRDAALAEVDIARQAAIDLAAANRAKAQAHVDDGRALGLVTVWRSEIADLNAALRHYWFDRPDAFRPIVEQFAKDDLRCGKREIPGIRVYSEQVAR